MKKVVIFWVVVGIILTVGGILLFRGYRAPKQQTENLALAGQVRTLTNAIKLLQAEKSANDGWTKKLENQVIDLQAENTTLTNTVEALRAESLAFAGQVGTLQTEKAALADQVGALQTNRVILIRLNEVLKEENAALAGQVGVLKTNNAALALRVGELNARLTNVLAAAVVPTTSIPAATPVPATTAPTNMTGVIVSTPTSAVGTVGTKVVDFYPTQTIGGTNLVGMVDGLPVLIDNTSRKELTVTLRRVASPGSITLNIAPKKSERLMFLPGKYDWACRIKGRGEEADKGTLTVSRNAENDLVIGVGVYAATLTLVDY